MNKEYEVLAGLNDQQKEEYFELWKTYHKGV